MVPAQAPLQGPQLSKHLHLGSACCAVQAADSAFGIPTPREPGHLPWDSGVGVRHRTPPKLASERGHAIRMSSRKSPKGHGQAMPPQGHLQEPLNTLALSHFWGPRCIAAKCLPRFPRRPLNSQPWPRHLLPASFPSLQVIPGDLRECFSSDVTMAGSCFSLGIPLPSLVHWAGKRPQLSGV